MHLRAPGGGFESALEVAIAASERAGARMCIVMPPPFGQIGANPNAHEYDAFLLAVRRSGGRVAFLGGGGSLNALLMTAAVREGSVSEGLLRAFTAQAEAIARDGAAGYGEIAIEHLSHFTGHPYESVAADHPLLLRLAEIAARHGMPIDVHMDVVAQEQPLPAQLASPPNPRALQPNVAAFERLLDHEPRAKIVLAHAGWDVTGQFTAALAHRLLAAHANLYLSIKIQPAGSPANNPLAPEGVKPEWLALFREFPGRFVIGSDSFYAAEGARGAGTQSAVAGPARLLSRLPPELARAIGHSNALAIYRLK